MVQGTGVFNHERKVERMGSLSMVGRVLLLVGCTAAGNYLAARPMRRYRELMDAAQLVGELQSRLQYSLLPAAELLEQLSQEPRFCALPYLRQFAAGKADFPQRWQQAVQDCGGEFDADSRALLARIGEILGAYELSQQSRQLSWVQQQLEQGAQRILQESVHEKRMYAALGPLLGMALCILIG